MIKITDDIYIAPEHVIKIDVIDYKTHEIVRVYLPYQEQVVVSTAVFKALGYDSAEEFAAALAKSVADHSRVTQYPEVTSMRRPIKVTSA